MKQFKTFGEAWRKSNTPILADANAAIINGKLNINTSSILDVLIQDTGRFVEHYASDLFIGWQSVLDELNAIVENPVSQEKVIVFGLRESGVDNNDYVISKLRDSIHPPFGYVSTAMYRRILAIQIAVGNDEIPHVRMKLRNVTHCFVRLEDEDVPRWGNDQREAFISHVSNAGDKTIAQFLGTKKELPENEDEKKSLLCERFEKMSRTELYNWVKELDVRIGL